MTTTIEEQTISAAAALNDKLPFVYVDSCLTRSDDDNDEQYEGCTCSPDGTCRSCSCATRFGLNYDSAHCLNPDKTGPVLECNSECSCSFETCQNRVSQQEDYGSHVQIVAASLKGYGVILTKAILQPGRYLGEYVGEVLSEDEAHRRISASKDAEHNYLLLYNEHHSSAVTKTFVDARYYGNWTRFINHSCAPNLHIVPIRSDSPSPPRLAFFALRAIEANEELSYSYGTVVDEQNSKPCHCSSGACTGFMPYQQTD